MDQTEVLFTWLDREVGISGVVAVGSRCSCGEEASVALHSPRWGDWDACSRCAVEQFVTLHGLWTLLDDLDRVTREATSSIQLDMMLGGNDSYPQTGMMEIQVYYLACNHTIWTSVPFNRPPDTVECSGCGKHVLVMGYSEPTVVYRMEDEDTEATPRACQLGG